MCASVCVTCRVGRDTYEVSSLSGICIAPPLDVAFHLAVPKLVLCAAPASGQPRLLASATTVRLNTTLMVQFLDVSNGHRL